MIYPETLTYEGVEYTRLSNPVVNRKDLDLMVRNLCKDRRYLLKDFISEKGKVTFVLYRAGKEKKQ